MKRINVFIVDVLAIFIAVGFILGCGSSGGGSGGGGGSSSVTLSGTVEHAETEIPEGGVTISVVRASDNQTLDSDTSAAGTGAWSLTVTKNVDVYLRIAKSNFVTLNTFIFSFDADEPNMDLFAVPTTLGEQLAQAFGVLGVTTWGDTATMDHCWFAGFIEDNTGNAFVGAEVTSATKTPDILYQKADGSFDFALTTIDPSGGPQVGGFDETSDLCDGTIYSFTATGTGLDETITAPFFAGEMAFLYFEQP
ncbi:MAG: hypothetical protein ACYSR0_10845 [Planctomycetota bacterium]|jgi:hypothetical protein